MGDLRITFDEVMTDGQLRVIADRLRGDLKHRGHRNFQIDVVDQRGKVQATYGVHGAAGVASNRDDNYQS